jgi:hypothetical protein
MSAIKLAWTPTEDSRKRAALFAALSAPLVFPGAHRSSAAPSVQIYDWRPV